jgi:hypothetical protein
MAPPAAGGSRRLWALGGVVWLVWPGNELHLRTPSRWRHRRTSRRQPEVLKNGLDRAAFAEEREHHPATATSVALEHVLALRMRASSYKSVAAILKNNPIPGRLPRVFSTMVSFPSTTVWALLFLDSRHGRPRGRELRPLSSGRGRRIVERRSASIADRFPVHTHGAERVTDVPKCEGNALPTPWRRLT